MGNTQLLWLLDMLRIWLRYIAVVIAAFPAGLLRFALLKAGMGEYPSLLFSALICLSLTYLIWHVLDRKLFGTQSKMLATKTTNAAADLIIPTSGLRLAGSVSAVLLVASVPATQL